MRSRAAILLGWTLAFVVLATSQSPVASAAAPRRVFHATLSGGSAVLTIATDMSGTFTLALLGRRHSARYQVVIYTGICTKPETVLTLPPFRTDVNGAG